MGHINESRPARGDSRDAFCRRGSTSDGISQIPRTLQAPRYEPRFRRQIEAIHALGPCALAYLAEELAAGADLRKTVETYAELDGDFIAALGGNRFVPNLWAIGGES
jgi:hypothetical protein